MLNFDFTDKKRKRSNINVSDYILPNPLKVVIGHAGKASQFEINELTTSAELITKCHTEWKINQRVEELKLKNHKNEYLEEQDLIIENLELNSFNFEFCLPFLSLKLCNKTKGKCSIKKEMINNDQRVTYQPDPLSFSHQKEQILLVDNDMVNTNNDLLKLKREKSKLILRKANEDLCTTEILENSEFINPTNIRKTVKKKQKKKKKNFFNHILFYFFYF